MFNNGFRFIDFRFLTLLVAVASGCVDPAPATTSCADNPAGCICRSDESCGGENPRCETRTGKCVPCLPTNDNCTGGTRCVPDGSTYVCTVGCLRTSDCPRSAGVQQECCNSVCIDTSRSEANCGSCGSACAALANAEVACVGGGCLVAGCSEGWGDCDHKSTNGCETHVADDVQSCGACGTSCRAGSNSTATCAAGKCGVLCVQGFSDCDGNNDNGCEIDSSRDAMNCGACGMACSALPNASSTTCVAGKCTPATCNGWFGDCNRNPADGCEADTQSDVKNCGGCGLACPLAANGVSACQSGTCIVASCNAGYGDCDHNAANGCELPTLTDVKNCGGCGIPCTGVNGVNECQAGACVVSACNGGFGDCDGKGVNGCEVNTNSDVKNCNACGMACAVPPNADASCALGVCGVGACKAGYSNCNQDVVDGCEVDINTVQNCGGCGRVCAVPANASPQCLGQRCTIGQCNVGFANCDNGDGNGCERNLQTDPQACGKCGVVCTYKNAAGACAMGKCQMGACDAGRADCNKSDVDGCEQAVAADPNNCGGCGIVCPQNEPFCINGKCGQSSHAIEQLAWDFETMWEGCGNYSLWYSQDFGFMTWDDCEATANKFGAQYMGQTGWFGNYAAPYQWDERWVGEADTDNGWVSTGGWESLQSQAKKNQYKCILAYANGREHGNSQLPNSSVSANGKTYNWDDLGVIAESDCYTKAREAGARPLNPWMFNGVKQQTAFMVENHLCHGSTMYDGLGGYYADGESDHFYQCFIGYNP